MSAKLAPVLTAEILAARVLRCGFNLTGGAAGELVFTWIRSRRNAWRRNDADRGFFATDLGVTNAVPISVRIILIVKFAVVVQIEG